MAEVIIVKNQEEAGELYGRSVADLIKAKPNAVLGDRKSTRLNSSHSDRSRMPSSA